MSPTKKVPTSDEAAGGSAVATPLAGAAVSDATAPKAASRAKKSSGHGAHGPAAPAGTVADEPLGGQPVPEANVKETVGNVSATAPSTSTEPAGHAPTLATTATRPASSGGLPRRGASAPARRSTGPGPYADDPAFLAEQELALLAERETYRVQAETLRAEAESLALEREPGDVQFDEESGEGGTVAVDRERDLTLSAQATAAIEEIDLALAAIADKTYGACEHCAEPIPKARLSALPYARLCVACKSGGLHRR